MVVQIEFQSGHDLPKRAGRLDVVGTGGRIAGRMIMDQNQSAGIKIESAANGSPERQFASRLARSAVEVLGDEQPGAIEEKHHHAFLAASQHPACEILTERRAGRIDRLAQQHFMRSNCRKIASGNDQRRYRMAIEARFVDFLGQRLCRCGMDRAQRTEALDQTAGNDLALSTDDGAEYLRQDG